MKSTINFALAIMACFVLSACSNKSENEQTPAYLQKSMTNMPPCANTKAGCSQKDWEKWRKTH